MALKILIPVLLALVRPTVAQEKTATAARGTSGHLNLVPTLEEPPSSWLLQKDGFDTTLPLPTDVSDTNVQKRQSLPYVPDVLIVTLAALTLGVSFLLRELCRGGHDQKEQKKLVVKPSEATDAFGCTELHVAASEGSALAVRKLLEGGSDPNAREAWEETCSLNKSACFKMRFACSNAIACLSNICQESGVILLEVGVKTFVICNLHRSQGCSIVADKHFDFC